MFRKLLILIIFSLFSSLTFAQEVVVDIFEVGVNGFINIDNTSTIDVNPNINEVGIYSDVVVRVLDRNNNPIENREVSLYAVGNPAEVQFIQPTSNTDSDGYAIGKVRSTVQGSYTIKAVDTTYSEGDINIVDSATFTVFPIPTPSLLSEPYYTKGLVNRVYWGTLSGLSTYEYYAEVSKNADFNTIVANSGWVNTISYEFTNLQASQLYYYRVKARNVGGSQSDWSTAVFSTQDNNPPVIKPVDIQRVQSGNTFSGINIKFDVTDNFEVGSVGFFCKRENGTLDGCGTIEHSGARYYVSVPASDLERGAFGAYLDKYEFCVEAFDKAGNQANSCDFSIEVSSHIETPVPIFTNLINSIIKYINENLKGLNDAFTASFTASHEFALGLLSLVIYLIVLIISLAIIAQGVFVIPSFLLYQVLRFFHYFGLKKRGGALGIVYNAIDGKPVKFAKVRIYDGTNKLVLADVTNRNGQFFGFIDTGKYRVTVDRSHFLYPSELYKEYGLPKIGKLYRGEYLIVSKRNPMNLAIPLDPINIYSQFEKNHNLESKMISMLKALTFLLIAIGLTVSAFTFERYPNTLNLILLLMYIPAIGIFLKSVIKVKLKTVH